MPPASDSTRPIHDVLERLREIARQDGSIDLEDVLEGFGAASFVPALLVPALLVVSPLSGIPLFSSLCGISIAIIAAQMIFGRDHVWLPRMIRRRPIASERLLRGTERIEGAADWLDRHTRARLGWLFAWPVVLIPQILVVLCGLAMPVLELVPFSSSILGAAVVLFSTGFLTRDGVMLLAGLALMAVASGIPAFVLYRFGG